MDRRFFVIECVCIAWFTVEYVMRLFNARAKWATFIVQPLNIVDLGSHGCHIFFSSFSFSFFFLFHLRCTYTCVYSILRLYICLQQPCTTDSLIIHCLAHIHALHMYSDHRALLLDLCLHVIQCLSFGYCSYSPPWSVPNTPFYHFYAYLPQTSRFILIDTMFEICK